MKCIRFRRAIIVSSNTHSPVQKQYSLAHDKLLNSLSLFLQNQSEPQIITAQDMLNPQPGQTGELCFRSDTSGSRYSVGTANKFNIPLS